MSMKCFACKNGIMEKGVSTYTAQTSNCIVIIKNVPCMKCRQCGEVLYQTDILKKIEEIVKKAEGFATEVMIVDYNRAA